MTSIIAKNPTDAYLKTVQHVSSNGETYTARCFDMKETQNVLTSIENVLDGKVHCSARKLSYEYMTAFLDWLLTGETAMPDELKALNKNAARFDQNSTDLSSVGLPDNYSVFYGPRIAKQIQLVADEIIADNCSRRTTIVILDAEDNKLLDFLRNNKDATVEYPCTISTTFQVRNNTLSSTVHMRSQNAVMVLPVDIFLQTGLLKAMFTILSAEIKDLKLGSLNIFAASQHYFSSQEELVQEVLKEND